MMKLSNLRPAKRSTELSSDPVPLRLAPKPKPQPVSYNRFRQFERLLLIMELIAPLRRGASIDELLADVRDMTGTPYCHRTIYRDLQFLDRIGLVERVATGEADKSRRRYRWLGGSIRAAVAQQAAERVAELRA